MTQKHDEVKHPRTEKAAEDAPAEAGAPRNETPEDPAMPPNRDEPTDAWAEVPPDTVVPPVQGRAPVYSHVPRRPDYAAERDART